MQTAEWRFLLPETSGRTVAVLADADTSIAAAAREVAANDVLYWEIDRRRASQMLLSPRRAFATLARLGLTPVGAYWVKPGFPERRMYLPLDSRSALQWYLNTLYRPETRSRKLLHRALRTIASHGLLASVAPCYAVVAVRGAVPAGCGHAVLLAHATEPWSRMALVPFEGDAQPAHLVKLPRTTLFSEQVAWEHHVLTQLESALPDDLRESIPGSRLIEWRGLPAAVETFVRGSVVSTRTAATDAELLDDLQMIGDWLARFHAAAESSRVDARTWLTRHLVDGLCQEYAQLFPLTEAETRFFAFLRHYVDTSVDGELPLTWQHADFGPWNIYRDGRDVRVIDWATARIGPALADFVYFAMHWSAAIAERGRDAAAVARGIREQMAAYMHRLRVHWSLLPPLVAYTVLEQALDYVRRRAAAGMATDRAHNPYVGYLAAMAGRADALSRGDVW